MGHMSVALDADCVPTDHTLAVPSACWHPVAVMSVQVVVEIALEFVLDLHTQLSAIRRLVAMAQAVHA